MKASNSENSGEKFGAAVDAWGINIYRGRTFTNLFTQLKNNDDEADHADRVRRQRRVSPGVEQQSYYSPR